MNVNFSKSECLVTNRNGEVVMKGAKSKDNCYLWVPLVDEVATQSVTTLPSSAPFVLEHINGPPYVPDRTVATKDTSSILNTGEPKQTTQWLKPGFLNQSESSVQESIHD